MHGGACLFGPSAVSSVWNHPAPCFVLTSESAIRRVLRGGGASPGEGGAPRAAQEGYEEDHQGLWGGADEGLGKVKWGNA